MTKKKRRQPMGETIGGMVYGFEYQVFRRQPPPHELVQHARPDASVAGADGSKFTFELPGEDDERRPAMLDMELRELVPQQTVAVRVRKPMAEMDMAAVFGQYRPLVLGALGKAGLTPTGAPFARYHQWGPDVADVEIGIPVAELPPDLAALADVEPGQPGASSLPGGTAGVALHRGPYGGLPPVYDELHDWIHAHGHEEGRGPWESYLDNPAEVEPGALRTEVIWPVG